MAPPAKPKSGGFAARMTRKVGPLPVWAWAALILAAGYLIYRRRGTSSSSASQTTAVPVTPDVTGSNTGALGSSGSDTGGGSQIPAPVDLSGITGELDTLAQQLAAQSAGQASSYQQGGPPGSTDQGSAAAPASSTPVSAYHPSYTATPVSTPNFGAVVAAKDKALGSAAPFGGVTSTRTTATGTKITTYASGRVVEQAPGKTAYVAKR